MTDQTQTETTDNAAPDVLDVRRRLLENERALASFFYERADVIRMAHVAFLCREHVLWVGPPGTAKSLLARSIATQFDDASHREFLLSRQATESDVIAHKDVPAFMAGNERWINTGHLTDAHFAFADEIFKASGSTLNAMLGWLNERRVKGCIASPLISCIGASNEFGEDDSLKALRDRFAIAHVVEGIAKRDNVVAFLRDRASDRTPPKLEPIRVHELEAAQQEIRTVPVDDAVFEALADLHVSLQGVGVQVTDRTNGKVVSSLLKAYAWLDGASSVGLEHVECLRHVLWNDPAEIPAVEAALGGVDKGIVGEIRAIVEAALSEYYTLTASRRDDGTWRSSEAQRTYATRCGDLIVQMVNAGREIQSKFGGQVPERVKARAREYMKELQDAHAACKRDSDLGIK